jgi:hypothetical protein
MVLEGDTPSRVIPPRDAFVGISGRGPFMRPCSPDSGGGAVRADFDSDMRHGASRLTRGPGRVTAGLATGPPDS